MAGFVGNITAVFGIIFIFVSQFLDIIKVNPVLWGSVLFALVGGIAIFAITVIKRFGVRGLASSGRRRRIRR